MSRVRSKDTGPEMRVRRLAHALGFRFRLHRKDLAGTPDLTFPKHRVALFVHGCFWHRHPGCSKASMPKTRVEFWKDKFQRNEQRDDIVKSSLEALGWRIMIVWECQVKEGDQLERLLRGINIQA
jgi:DNA mismatch endonuclease, patch repair protein